MSSADFLFIVNEVVEFFEWAELSQERIVISLDIGRLLLTRTTEAFGVGTIAIVNWIDTKAFYCVGCFYHLQRILFIDDCIHELDLNRLWVLYGNAGTCTNVLPVKQNLELRSWTLLAMKNEGEEWLNLSHKDFLQPFKLCHTGKPGISSILCRFPCLGIFSLPPQLMQLQCRITRNSSKLRKIDRSQQNITIQHFSTNKQNCTHSVFIV